ncbi:hypothetical protein ACWIBQ_14035 [Microbacterium keratanolyticum]
MSAPLVDTPRTTLRFPVNRRMVLIIGAILIPFALSAIFNSYGPLTEETALRMAFAGVAGQTIAILSAVAIVVMTIRRRLFVQLPVMAVIAALVIAAAVGTMTTQGTLLVQRLDRVAETALLNE